MFAMMLFGFAIHARAGSLAISGQAPSSVVAGQLYVFQPTVSGDYSKSIRYSIANKPVWLSFSQYTGKLSGVPGESNVGVYSNIVITAKTWRKQASLPAFSITVKTAQVANTAPVISGIPAITGTAGQFYSFKPNASDSNGDVLTFSVQNKPAWASFNTSTGALSGTPASEGQYSNIVISVSDGKATASLAPFTLTISPVVLGSATITWAPPTINVDGTPLDNLAGFRVLYGTDPNQLDQKLGLPAPTLTSVEVADLAPGTYYFAVKAYTASAVESAASQVVWKTIL